MSLAFTLDDWVPKDALLAPNRRDGIVLADDLPYINVRDHGAVGDGVTDDSGAFLRAFIEAGANGRRVFAPAGQYYFASTVELDTATLGFTWLNIYLSGEGCGSAFDGYETTSIYVNGISAFKINKTRFGQQRIGMEHLAFSDTSTRYGTLTYSTVPSSYASGTISVTNGSAVITGNNVSWTTDGSWVGKRINIEGVVYTILTVDTASQITLTGNYAGTTDAVCPYTIYLSGYVATTNGSAVITGLGTSWTTDGTWTGKYINIDGTVYTISSVDSATQITLTANFTGTTAYDRLHTVYRANGTAVATSGSTTVTGTGTSWTSAMNGMRMRIGAREYTIDTVASTTSLTLTSAFQETTGYATGTIAVTNGSPTVTGTGTSWESGSWVGRFIDIGGVTYRVLSVNSATQITLATNYAGSTASGLSYLVWLPVPWKMWKICAAIHLQHDPSAGTNYSVGNSFEHITSQNFESTIWYEAQNMASVQEGFLGMQTVNHIHTYDTKYVVRVTGATLNHFIGSNWMAHLSSFYIERARTGTNYVGGGNFRLDDVYWQSSEPAMFIVEDGCSPVFSIKNHSTESCGVANRDGLLAHFGTSGVPEFIFHGYARVPGGSESTPRVERAIVSAYTSQPLNIVPYGTIIRTPENVRVEAPRVIAGDYAAANRTFFFGVPRSLALGAPVRLVPEPIAGIRAAGANSVGGYRTSTYPYLYNADQDAQAITYLTNQAIANPDSKTTFTVAQCASIVGSGTRFLNNAITIDGNAISQSTANTDMPWTDGEYVIVYGVGLRSGEAISALTVQLFRNAGTLTPISCGYGSWNYDNRAINMLIPENHTQEWYESLGTGSSSVVRVTGTGGVPHGIACRVTVTVNGGINGSGAWILYGVTGGAAKGQAAVYSNAPAGITFTAGNGNTTDLGTVTVANTTGSTVTVRARIEYL